MKGPGREKNRSARFRLIALLTLLCAVGSAAYDPVAGTARAHTGVAPPAGLLVTPCGDPSNDDQVSAADALMALQAAVGLGYCSVIYCDANGSGNTTALDALIILQAAVGLSVDLSCPLTAIVEITLTPSTGLLTPPSGGLLANPFHHQETVVARALDERGEEIAADVTWHSSHPDQISTDQSGVVTALSWGSGQVWAEADGVESHRANFVVAVPAAGAQLVTDSQVVGNISPVDPASSPSLGYQYRVTLHWSTPPPTVGSILVGTGEAPVGGRVVAIKNTFNGTVVTLEMVSIPELFAAISLDEEIDLSHASFEVPEQVSRYYDSTTNRDGSLTLTLKSGVARSVSATPTRAQRPHDDCNTSDGWTAYGPFCCKSSTGAPLALNLAPSITVTSRLVLADALKPDGSLSKLSLKGLLKVEGKVEITFTSQLEATATCEIITKHLLVPFPGPLALVFGGEVDLGFGAVVGGKIPLAGVGIESSATVEVNAEVGVACPTDSCTPIRTFTPSGKAGLKPKLSWVIEEGVRVELNTGVFGMAKLKVGANSKWSKYLNHDFLPNLQIALFKLKGGPTVKGKFATVESQIADPGYKSSHQATADFSIEAGPKIDDWLNILAVNVGNLKFTSSDILASSPTAAVAKASVASYQSGDTVAFTVELEPENLNFFPGDYNVNAVHIYRKDPNGVQLVASQTATAGQWQFGGKKSSALAWSANKPGDIGDNFFAFVDAALLCYDDCDNPVERYVGRLEMKQVAPGVDSASTTSTTSTTTSTSTITTTSTSTTTITLYECQAFCCTPAVPEYCGGWCGAQYGEGAGVCPRVPHVYPGGASGRERSCPPRPDFTNYSDVCPYWIWWCCGSLEATAP